MRRHSACDICIRIPSVSRRHCQIVTDEENTCWLMPLALKQITLLNGEEIKESIELQHGDIISICGRCFRYERGLNFFNFVILMSRR